MYYPAIREQCGACSKNDGCFICTGADKDCKNCESLFDAYSYVIYH